MLIRSSNGNKRSRSRSGTPWVTSTIAQEPHGELPAFALPPGLSEFQAALAQLWEEVTAALDDLRVREAFSQALEDLKQIFARPASAATILPRLLIDALEGLLLVGIDVAKVLVGGLLRLAKYAFAALRSLVTAEAPMPMLSALYRRISGGAALSLLDASYLALAVPCTITHKLMHGRAPFPAPEARSTQSDFDSFSIPTSRHLDATHSPSLRPSAPGGKDRCLDPDEVGVVMQ